jgi:hypothetical protein
MAWHAGMPFISGMAWHGMAWHGMFWVDGWVAWHGMAWHGMFWVDWGGMAWHGMFWVDGGVVWHGMACFGLTGGMAWNCCHAMPTRAGTCHPCKYNYKL